MRLIILTTFLRVALCTVALTACGSESATNKVRRNWSVGDTDPFGCPIVEPSVWVSTEQHAEYCGAGCTPMGGQPASQDDNSSRFFVACVSDDIPSRGDGLVPAISVCLTSPVDDGDYVFGNPSIAWPLHFLCWPLCGSDTLRAPSASYDIPDECFE
jgi:hypothetical protein